MTAMTVRWLAHKGEILLVLSEPANHITFSPEQARNAARGILDLVDQLTLSDPSISPEIEA